VTTQKSGRLFPFSEIPFGSFRELYYEVGLSKRFRYSVEHDISGYESRILEAEKILCALRGINAQELIAFRLQPKHPEQLHYVILNMEVKLPCHFKRSR